MTIIVGLVIAALLVVTGAVATIVALIGGDRLSVRTDPCYDTREPHLSR
ncbi:MAG: hypothetical protein QM604_08100 [Microbacterium sp.]